MPDRGGAIAPPPVPEAVSAADVGTYSVNYRNEPLALRVFDPETGLQAIGPAGDLSLALSSTVTRADPSFNVLPAFYPPLTADVRVGDPFTPMPRAYVNDRVKVRIQVGATEEGHSFSIHGLKWLQEYASPNSGWRNSQMMGISEQFILDTIIPPNPQQTEAADYLYSANSSSEGFWNGVWGIMRSYARPRGDLLALPGNAVGEDGLLISNPDDFTGMAPADAPVREFDVTAVAAQDALPGGALVYNSRINGRFGPLQDPTAIMYVRTVDLDDQGKLKPGVPVEPLILRVAAGERIVLTLRNRLPEILPNPAGANLMPLLVPGFNAGNVTPSSRVGLHPQLVAYSIGDADGADAGINPVQSIAPGETRVYEWYAGDIKLDGGNLTAAPIEFGATNLSSSDKIMHSNKGAVGALIIEPQGSAWVEDANSRASATVTRADGTSFRDFVLVFQDDINLRAGNSALPNIGAEDDAEDSGQKAVNYRAEPMWFRMGIPPGTVDVAVIADDFSSSLSNSLVGGDPQVPVFIAEAGTPIRFRILKPGGHNRNEAFALNGHVWQRGPYINGSTEIGNNPLSQWIGGQEGVGPANHFDVVPIGGAGGQFGVLGDYLFRDMSPSHFTNGAWGILRVVRGAGLGGLISGAGLILDQHDKVVGQVELASLDRSVALTLEANTTLLGAGGGPVQSLSGNVAPAKPAPPAGTFILQSFELGPAGTTFSPAATLSFSFDSFDLPPSDLLGLSLLAWDGTQWSALPHSLRPGAAETYIATTQTASSGLFALVRQLSTAPAGGDNGGGGTEVEPVATEIAVSGLTSDVALIVSSDGVMQSAARLRSADGRVTIDIPSGAVPQTAAGARLNLIALDAPNPAPAAPPGKAIVFAADIGPVGAHFDLPLTLTLSYDPASLPAGVAEDSLVVAWWNGAGWLTLPTTRNAGAGTISAAIGYFTTVAVMAERIPAVVITAPEDGATLSPAAPAPAIEEPSAARDWRLIAGAGIALAAIAGLAVLVWRRVW